VIARLEMTDIVNNFVAGPEALGIPVTAPVEAFKIKPAGSAPLMIDHVYGGVPPEAFSVTEYAVPTSRAPKREF
jgi:hypothetical protein